MAECEMCGEPCRIIESQDGKVNDFSIQLSIVSCEVCHYMLVFFCSKSPIVPIVMSGEALGQQNMTLP